jgi:hypothetical protein
MKIIHIKLLNKPLHSLFNYIQPDPTIVVLLSFTTFSITMTVDRTFDGCAAFRVLLMDRAYGNAQIAEHL